MFCLAINWHTVEAARWGLSICRAWPQASPLFRTFSGECHNHKIYKNSFSSPELLPQVWAPYSDLSRLPFTLLFCCWCCFLITVLLQVLNYVHSLSSDSCLLQKKKKKVLRGNDVCLTDVFQMAYYRTWHKAVLEHRSYSCLCLGPWKVRPQASPSLDWEWRHNLLWHCKAHGVISPPLSAASPAPNLEL